MIPQKDFWEEEDEKNSGDSIQTRQGVEDKIENGQKGSS